MFGDTLRHTEYLKTYTPSLDWPMLYTGNPYIIQPGNVFFMHMILMDSDSNLAMNLGENVSCDREWQRKIREAKTGFSSLIGLQSQVCLKFQ